MKGIPFGYRLEAGEVAIDKEAADKVVVLFESYLGGTSLENAAKAAGLCISHSHARRMLSNPVYLGSGEYPQIISEGMFRMVGEILEKKAGYTRDIRKDVIRKKETAQPKEWNFTLLKAETTYEDPKLQAEYVWSLVRRNEG